MEHLPLWNAPIAASYVDNHMSPFILCRFMKPTVPNYHLWFWQIYTFSKSCYVRWALVTWYVPILMFNYTRWVFVPLMWVCFPIVRLSGSTACPSGWAGALTAPREHVWTNTEGLGWCMLQVVTPFLTENYYVLLQDAGSNFSCKEHGCHFLPVKCFLPCPCLWPSELTLWLLRRTSTMLRCQVEFIDCVYWMT